MGSVSKVIKRASAKGGSARRNFVRREKQHEWCFGLFDPENCGRFNIFCPVDKDEDEVQHADIFWSDSLKSNEGMTAISESEGTSSTTEGAISPASAASKAKHYASFKSSSIITYESKDSFFALKSIRLDQCKDDVLREELLNEIAILQRLDHPHIVKALETFQFNDRLYVVLELCSGGDLYARDPYTETQACSIIHDILDAIAYMHARGITHRDLKFENIMFSSPDLDAVKVIDFGLSKKYSQQEHLHDTVGAYKKMKCCVSSIVAYLLSRSLAHSFCCSQVLFTPWHPRCCGAITIRNVMCGVWYVGAQELFVGGIFFQNLMMVGSLAPRV